MISQLLDVITKLSSYAMVIFLALFAYSKVTQKPEKYPYGRYALISLLLFAVFGTLFFNSPKGKAVLKAGNAGETTTARSTKNVSTLSTEKQVRQALKSPTLLFKHRAFISTQNKNFNVTILDNRDTVDSLKLTTVDLLKAIKKSRYQKYQKFTISFQSDKANPEMRLKTRYQQTTIRKLNPQQLSAAHLKALSDQYYEAGQ